MKINYVLSSNLLFCDYYILIISSYDETHDVIYEVIMRKFRASIVGTFLRLEIQ